MVTDCLWKAKLKPSVNLFVVKSDEVNCLSLPFWLNILIWQREILCKHNKWRNKDFFLESNKVNSEGTLIE